MKTYTRYWVASMVRGLLALITGMAILFIPQMISLVFLLPFAVLISMLCLAAYGTIDSALVLATSFMVPQHGAGRIALKVQGIGGGILGILLFALVYDRAQFWWFIYFAAFQAAGAAVAEFVVAQKTSKHHGSRWCYLAGTVATIAAVALLFGQSLSPQGLAWLLFGYLGVFGSSLSALSARMLFAERDVPHDVSSRASALANAR